MTNDARSLYEARATLERWMSYYEGKGQSTGLYADTAALVEKLPEPPRYIPTAEETARMEGNGE